MIPTSRVRLKARSKKRIRDMVIRRKIVAELLETRAACELRWDDGCTGRATEVDERCGRGRGGSFLDLSNLQTTCSHCHRMKTANPAEAERRGLSESSADYRARKSERAS